MELLKFFVLRRKLIDFPGVEGRVRHRISAAWLNLWGMLEAQSNSELQNSAGREARARLKQLRAQQRRNRWSTS